jgi:hypothetical protein
MYKRGAHKIVCAYIAAAAQGADGGLLSDVDHSRLWIKGIYEAASAAWRLS